MKLVETQQQQDKREGSSIQVFPANTQLIAERFRQRQGNGVLQRDRDHIENMEKNSLELLAPETECITAKSSNYEKGTVIAPKDIKKQQELSLPQILNSEEGTDAENKMQLASSNSSKTETAQQSSSYTQKRKNMMISNDGVKKEEPRKESFPMDSKIMASCSLVMGSAVIAAVNTLSHQRASHSSHQSVQTQPSTHRAEMEQKLTTTPEPVVASSVEERVISETRDACADFREEDCLVPVAKVDLPYTAQESIDQALASLRPDPLTDAQKQSFFEIDDGLYNDAVCAILQEVGEFDYEGLKREMEISNECEFPTYNPSVVFLQTLPTESNGPMPSPEQMLSEAEIDIKWQRRVQCEIQRRLTGRKKLKHVVLEEAQMQKLHAAQAIEPEQSTQASPMKTAREEEEDFENFASRRKRDHKELMHSPCKESKDRYEKRMEEMSRSRKKPKPQIAFGRRVHPKEEKENRMVHEDKNQMQHIPKHSLDKKRSKPDSAPDIKPVKSFTPLLSSPALHESVMDTMVDALMSASCKMCAPAEDQLHSDKTNVDLEALPELNALMHTPMLDITNQNDHNSMAEVSDHDFIGDLVSLFPISKLTLWSQEREQLKDTEINQRKHVQVPEDVKIVSMTRDEQKADNHHKTKAVIDKKLRVSTLKDSQNEQVDEHPRSTAEEIGEVSKSKKRLWRLENQESEVYSSSEDLQILEASSAPIDPTWNTSNKSETSSTPSERLDPKKARIKNSSCWNDFKKKHFEKQRQRLYSKHGIYDPLLFTSSETVTSSESGFSACFTTLDLNAI